RSQLVICVRTDPSIGAKTGVLERNDAFAHARPRKWQWLEVKARDLLDNRHAPNFGAPWIGFLWIFNTYELDIGLQVAEFIVSRPGERVAQCSQLVHAYPA